MLDTDRPLQATVDAVSVEDADYMASFEVSAAPVAAR